MIGRVFRKQGINFIFGQSGLGKTVSSIKAINEDEITPILLDFDGNNSPEQNNCKFIHIDGWAFMKSYKDPEVATSIPTGQVIVIDTWHMFSEFYYEDSNLLPNLAEGNTIVIIGHVLDLATRQDIPDAKAEFVNHCDSKLYLSYDRGSTVKGKERPAGPVLEIKKLRGYSGPMQILNWMRSK